MRYPVFPPSDAPAIPADGRPQGYLYNNGGLNNQKIALAGLLLHGAGASVPVKLPHIAIKDPHTGDERLTRLENVFEVSRITDFAASHGLALDLSERSGLSEGWPYFESFAARLRDDAIAQSDRALLAVLNAFVPKVISTPAFARLRQEVFGRLGMQAVIQLRIEADWADYAKSTLHPIIGALEDYDLTFVQILAKVRATFPDLRRAYVTLDERAMPVAKDDIRARAHDEFGIDLTWKSDVLDTSDAGPFNGIDLAMLDFEVAKAAPLFVGLSNSTFCNMACLETYARTGRAVTHHFVYNFPGRTVRRRQDNGYRVNAWQAVHPAGDPRD